MNEAIEYKIINGTTSECQKLLNQWEHEFEINILDMTAWNDGTIVILLTRKRI